MSERKLREALQTLHEELGENGSQPVDPDSRALLETVSVDLQRVLDDEDSDEPPGALGSRVERAAIRFESEHPRLATALNEVVNALARMGI